MQVKEGMPKPALQVCSAVSKSVASAICRVSISWLQRRHPDAKKYLFALSLLRKTCRCWSQLINTMRHGRTYRHQNSRPHLQCWLRACLSVACRFDCSSAPETIYEERPWIEVVPCLLTFFDRYCHLYVLCLLHQIFLAADSYKLFSSPQRAYVTFFVKRDKLELAFWLLCSVHAVIH